MNRKSQKLSPMSTNDRESTECIQSTKYITFQVVIAVIIVIQDSQTDKTPWLHVYLLETDLATLNQNQCSLEPQ